MDQVNTEYLPTYGKKLKPDAAWKADDSLFAFFIGINDVLNTYGKSDKSLVSKIFDEYASLVEKVSYLTSDIVSSCGLNIRIGLRLWCTQLPVSRCAASAKIAHATQVDRYCNRN
jgi:hypothetical protein